MTFALLGFLSFMLTSTYIDQDVAEPLRSRLSHVLARWGWCPAPTEGKPWNLKPRKGGALGRVLYQIQDCPYCASTWVAFGATWYTLREHPWHRTFWLTWLAATGVAWAVVAVQVLAQEMIETMGRWSNKQKGEAEE